MIRIQSIKKRICKKTESYNCLMQIAIWIKIFQGLLSAIIALGLWFFMISDYASILHL